VCPVSYGTHRVQRISTPFAAWRFISQCHDGIPLQGRCHCHPLVVENKWSCRLHNRDGNATRALSGDSYLPRFDPHLNKIVHAEPVVCPCVVARLRNRLTGPCARPERFDLAVRALPLDTPFGVCDRLAHIGASDDVRVAARLRMRRVGGSASMLRLLISSRILLAIFHHAYSHSQSSRIRRSSASVHSRIGTNAINLSRIGPNGVWRMLDTALTLSRGHGPTGTQSSAMCCSRAPAGTRTPERSARRMSNKGARRPE
jgi:hypothetical protein